jgi:hypothetical protein
LPTLVEKKRNEAATCDDEHGDEHACDTRLGDNIG